MHTRFSITSLFFLLLLSFSVYSQSQQKKSLHAKRIYHPPKIDAHLGDTCWQHAPVAGDFIQYELTPGAPSARRSEVQLLYDDLALYIGAKLFDPSPDSILRELSTRDNEANADLFGVFFDTYNDDINAYLFAVTAAGTQIDGRLSSEGFDANWNGVWSSAHRHTPEGWVVEMRIPYSALRFQNSQTQKWGLNIFRKVRKLREFSFWNFCDPRIDAWVIQAGDLEGLEGITPPPRLSFSPYIAGLLNHSTDPASASAPFSYNVSGGADIKYGISDAFTLDMTLVPDFSQVQSDNKVLNLSPFEVQYQERRPFFTEGTELFNKGGLFYSRRIGGRPIDFDKVSNGPDSVLKNPSQTQLINATKLSGRTKKKLGLGIFNAVTDEVRATVIDREGNTVRPLTSPLINYNILVLDQALKNNSYFTLINTNVLRNARHYDANVTGMMLKLNNKKNMYSVTTSGFTSVKLHPDQPEDRGYAANFEVGKTGGNLRCTAYGNLKTDRFDNNDMGLQFITNFIESGISLAYNVYTPFWKLNNCFNSVKIVYQRMYKQNAFWNFGIYGNSVTTFRKKFITYGIDYGFEPVITYDYYEPRNMDRFYRYPINYRGGGFVSSDYRRRFALDVGFSLRIFDENRRLYRNVWISPRFRVNNKLSFIFESSFDNNTDDIGFVGRNDAGDTIYFGRRNLHTISNILSSALKFSNKTSLTFRLRHYWSEASYSQYYELGADGALNQSTYSVNKNRNFNALNLDVVFFWQFAPGSELNLIWKDAVQGEDQFITGNYGRNFGKTFDLPQNNALTIKVLYYIDYLMLKRKKKNA